MGVFSWWPRSHQEIFDGLNEERNEEVMNQPEAERMYYSLGPTTEGRVMLRVYYGNVSFNRVGIDTLIKALESSKMWLEESGEQPEDGCQKENQPV